MHWFLLGNSLCLQSICVAPRGGGWMHLLLRLLVGAWGPIYTGPLSGENVELLLHFSCPFTWKWHLMGFRGLGTRQSPCKWGKLFFFSCEIAALAHCCITPTSGVVKTQQARVNHIAFTGETLKGFFSRMRVLLIIGALVSKHLITETWGPSPSSSSTYLAHWIKGIATIIQVSKLKFGLDLTSLRQQQLTWRERYIWQVPKKPTWNVAPHFSV